MGRYLLCVLVLPLRRRKKRRRQFLQECRYRRPADVADKFTVHAAIVSLEIHVVALRFVPATSR